MSKFDTVYYSSLQFRISSEYSGAHFLIHLPTAGSEILFKLCQSDEPIYMYVYIYDGEGNGTPLQYSCLENLMGGGAW